MFCVDSVPPVTRITNDPQEQDYPADRRQRMARSGLPIRSSSTVRIRAALAAHIKEAPHEFSAYAAPTGGDHIVAALSAIQDPWSAPIEIGPRATATFIARRLRSTAPDGRGCSGRRTREANSTSGRAQLKTIKPGKPARLPSEAGTDMDPVAATDAKGNCLGCLASLAKRPRHNSAFPARAAAHSHPVKPWRRHPATNGIRRSRRMRAVKSRWRGTPIQTATTTS